MTEETNKVTIQESKFNGTSTFVVENADCKEEATSVARRFWKEEYGHRPSKIVSEKDSAMVGDSRYIVMVADHSSGSLKQSKEYEF